MRQRQWVGMVTFISSELSVVACGDAERYLQLQEEKLRVRDQPILSKSTAWVLFTGE
jgi:hypothetical protein